MINDLELLSQELYVLFTDDQKSVIWKQDMSSAIRGGAKRACEKNNTNLTTQYCDLHVIADLIK
jgi:hypothetical protein